MSGLITKAALLSACGMLVAVAAMAGVPSAANSDKPTFIRLVGQVSSVADTAGGKFTITVRDIANNTITGSNVVVDLSGCVTTDIKLANNHFNPNYTLNCTNKTVSAFTNNAGVVAFTLLGNSFATALHTGLGCARIYADGVLLSSPTVSTFDLDGAGGVAIGDLSVFLGDLGAGIPYRERSDYDASSTVAIGDLSVWLGRLGSGKSSGPTTVACP
jgi:hypothetical protein